MSQPRPQDFLKKSPVAVVATATSKAQKASLKRSKVVSAPLVKGRSTTELKTSSPVTALSPSLAAVTTVHPQVGALAGPAPQSVTVLPVSPRLNRSLSDIQVATSPVKAAENVAAGSASAPAPSPPMSTPAIPPVSASVAPGVQTPPVNKPTMAQAVLSGAGGRPQGRADQPRPSVGQACPKKDQAILFPSIENVTISQYMRSLADIIGGKNITFASRMSQGRVCFYLRTKALVDTFMLDHGGLSIKDQFLAARRLVTPAERLVLSNVSPHIPHQAVEAELAKLVRLVSPMAYITVGVKEADVGHVFSFRRQIFVVKAENINLPDSILVDYDGERNRVFLSFDDIKCFKCKQTGHIARACTVTIAKPVSADEASTVAPTGEKRKNPASGGSAEATASTSGETSSAGAPVEVDEATGPPPPDTMDCSEISLLSAKEGENFTLVSKPSKSRNKSPAKKRPRQDEGATPVEVTMPLSAVELLNSKESTNALTTTAFLQFFTDVKGTDQPLRVALRFTADIRGLVDMLELIKPAVRDVRAVRARVRRLAGTLIKAQAYFEATGEDTHTLSRSNSQESLESNDLE